MKVEIKDRTYYFGLVISIAIGIISTYAQSKDPQTGLFLFLALAGAIFHIELRQDLNFFDDKVYPFCFLRSPCFLNTKIYSCWSAKLGSEALQ